MRPPTPVLLAATVSMFALLSEVALMEAGAASTLSARNADSAVPTIRVGPTVHVSASRPTIAHDEVVIGADPSDAKRLIACSMTTPSSGSTDPARPSVAYVSLDNGRTWVHGTTTELPTADPSCEYAPDGSVYFATTSSHTRWDRLGAWTLELHRSRDGGRTWDKPRFSAGGDRPWLTVDHTSSDSPAPIYITYQSPVRRLHAGRRPAPMGLFLKRSDDGGETWEAPAVRLSETDRSEITAVTPDRAVVLSDGAVVIMYRTPEDFPGEAPSRPPLAAKGLAQYVTTSIDRGRTLTGGTKIANLAMLHGFTGAPAGFGSLAVDPGSTFFKDRLYAAWGDARTGRSEIWFSYSEDTGATWSPPRVVSDDQPWRPPAVGPDNNMPTLAVSKTGVVGLMWYDRRENPDNIGFYPRFRASLDGGETWLPSVRLTEIPNRFEAPGQIIRLRPWATHAPGASGPLTVTFQRHWWPVNGHTAGLAADADSAFHALWVDNRSGINQVYTARIEVDGAGLRAGSQALATRDDVTALVTIEIRDAVLDRENNAIVAYARVRNTSRRTIGGPLVVRLLTITSELGAARLTSPDRGQNEGATWTLETPANGLAPRGATTEHVIRLQWSPVRNVMEGGDVRLNLIRFDARIFGTLK